VWPNTSVTYLSSFDQVLRVDPPCSAFVSHAPSRGRPHVSRSHVFSLNSVLRAKNRFFYSLISASLRQNSLCQVGSSLSQYPHNTHAYPPKISKPRDSIISKASTSTTANQLHSCTPVVWYTWEYLEWPYANQPLLLFSGKLPSAG